MKSVRSSVVRVAFALTFGLLAVAGCSDDGETSPTPPLPEPDPTTTTVDRSATTTTVASTTTLPPTTPPKRTTTTTTEPTRPTVTTLVPEVPKSELDPDDPNDLSDRPYEAAHAPVIKAYLQAYQAFHKVASSKPIDPMNPILTSAPFTGKGLQETRDALRGRAQEGEYMDVTAGISFRPYVVGPVSNEATIFDCQLSGVFYRDVETKAPVEPRGGSFATPGEFAKIAGAIHMVKRGDKWLFDSSQLNEAACS